MNSTLVGIIFPPPLVGIPNSGGGDGGQKPLSPSNGPAILTLDRVYKGFYMLFSEQIHDLEVKVTNRYILQSTVYLLIRFQANSLICLCLKPYSTSSHFPLSPFPPGWTLFMNEQAPDSSITGGRPINHVLLQHMLTRF